MRQHPEADEFSYGSTIRACGSAWLQSLLLCNQMLGRAWPWPGTCSHCFFQMISIGKYWKHDQTSAV